jgi:hypothetical protein
MTLIRLMVSLSFVVCGPPSSLFIADGACFG